MTKQEPSLYVIQESFGLLYFEELEALAVLVKHDLYLIADEVYREFTYDNKAHHSVLSLKGIEQHTIGRFFSRGIACVVQEWGAWSQEMRPYLLPQ